MAEKNPEIEFELLFKLSELASKTGFKIEQDKNNKNLFYLTEPNATIPFATLDYNKESENARANPKTSTLRECSTIFLRRVRGIIKEREDRSRAEISRSEEIQTGSRSICEGREETRTRDRQLHQFYDSQIWQQGLNLQERIKAEEFNKKIKEQYKQSESYKQQALKAYQQNVATLTPKNLQNEIALKTQSPHQEISPPDYEAILNADKGFRTEKTIQYTIEQIAKEYHLPIEQVKKEIDRILQRQEKENPKIQEPIQSKTQNQEVNKTQESKTLPPKRNSKTLENPKPTKEKEQSFDRGR